MKQLLSDWFRRIKLMIYALVIMIVFLIFILEIKRYYRIDLIPGVNGPLDDMYFEEKASWESEP